MKARILFHGVAILVLLATVAAAQTPGKPAVAASTEQSSDRVSDTALALDNATGNEQARGREISNGRMTGSRPHESAGIAAGNSLGSAHVTDTLIAFTQADKARDGQMQAVDMTARYRPRSNRISKLKPTAISATTPPGQ